MKEKILVPLNGSAFAEEVLPRIKNLVLQTVPGKEVEITLLQVISKLNFNLVTSDEAAQLPYSDAEVKELTQSAQNYLNSVAGKLAGDRVHVNTMVTFGQAAKEIVKAAHEIEADLIAMSTHGRNGLVRWAKGSVTHTVIRTAGNIPVFAVRATEKPQRMPVLTMDSLQSLVKHG